MFAERNGIKTLVRTTFRSLLFFLLIVFLSSILTLSLVLFSSIYSFLKECRESYRTTAVLEYLGKQYPDGKVYDGNLARLIEEKELDTGAILSLPEVLSYEDYYSELGVTEAKRLDKYVYDRSLGVIVVDSLMWDKNGETYMAVIRDVFYSQRDHRGKLVFIDPGAFPGVDIQTSLEKGNSYILLGHYIDGTSSYLWFSPEDQVFTLNGEKQEVRGYMRYEEGGDYSAYEDAAGVYRIQNSSFRLVYTNHPANLRPFSEEELTLESGRFYSEEETGGNFAILSDRAAAYLGKEVGDEVVFRLYGGEEGLYNIKSNQPLGEKSVTITGIYTSTENYPDWVFVSGSHSYDPDSVPTGCTLLEAQIDNDKVDSFYKKANDLLPKNFR
ncbi:MAG: hypothetical protein KBS81_08045, partial [Spirochaetales bacterium]|nr:hypothetical protein [Candidatus Physcosoma equi]